MFALMFIGLSRWRRPCTGSQFAYFCLLLSCLSALFSFLIQQVHLTCRPALLIHALDDNFIQRRPALNLLYIANMNRPSRFDAIAVEMHLATIHCFGCQWACLVKTRCPKPFIQSDRIHCGQQHIISCVEDSAQRRGDAKDAEKKYFVGL
jgi:hypothetical protein